MKQDVADRVKLRVFNHSVEWKALFENLSYSEAMEIIMETRDKKRGIQTNRRKLFGDKPASDEDGGYVG